MSEWCSLAHSASKAADAAKYRFEFSQKLELGLLLTAAFLQCLPETVYLSQKHLNWGTVAATSIALVTALIVKAIHLEKIWQEARTVSESSKKMMWFYIMKVPPFHQLDHIADNEFLISLDRIRDSIKECNGYLSKNLSPNDHITPWMANIRSKCWQDRRDDYANLRIAKQIEWYESKSSTNSKGDTITFGISIALEVIALLVAIAVLTGTISNTAWIGLVTTGVAVVLGWGKTKRHKQLAQSYSVTAYLLKNKKQLWKHLTSESDFLSEVEKTEELISRENTNWSVVIN